MIALSAKQRCLRSAERAIQTFRRLAQIRDPARLEAEAAERAELADRYCAKAMEENDPRTRRIFQVLAGQHAADELTIRARLAEGVTHD